MMSASPQCECLLHGQVAVANIPACTSAAACCAAAIPGTHHTKLLYEICMGRKKVGVTSEAWWMSQSVHGDVASQLAAHVISIIIKYDN
jgi:hypothetical protein